MGRNSREKNGLEPTKHHTVRVEPSVMDKAKQLHGSLANAIRFAAENNESLSRVVGRNCPHCGERCPECGHKPD